MKRFLLVGILVLAAAACGGGGGGGSSAVPPTTGGPTQGHNASAPVTLTFPNATTSSARRRAILTASTASFTLVVYTVNGATPSPQPSPIAIQLSNPQYCTTSGTGVTCSVDFQVPIAMSVVIEIETFDANGNLLAGGLIGPIDTTVANIPAQTFASLTVSPASLPSLLVGGSAGR